MSQELLTPDQLAEKVPGTTAPYWAQLRFKGIGPKYLKLSPRKVLYRWSDVTEWLIQAERTSTAVAS